MFLVGLTIDGECGPKDILVEVDSNATWESVERSICKQMSIEPTEYAFTLKRLGVALKPDTPMRTLDLRWGDVIFVAIDRNYGIDAVRRLLPAAGTSGEIVLIPDGVSILGREVADDVLRIGDSSVSRRHAKITASGLLATISDLNSSNGTSVNNLAIKGEVALHSGDEVIFGLAGYTFVTGENTTTKDLRHATEGIIPFNRPPRLLDAQPSTRFSIPAPPNKVATRKIPIATYIAPLIGAAVTAIMYGKPQMLLISLLSPLIFIATTITERRSGAGTYRTAAADFRQKVETQALDANQALDSFRVWAERRWPKVTAIAPLIDALDERLWWRRPSDDDFLQLRLGNYVRNSPIDLEINQGGAEELQEFTAEAFEKITKPQSLPLPLSLKEEGAIGIVGNQSQTTPFIHSLLVQIAAAHSHRDVAIDIIAPDSSSEFDDMKWLPHVTSMGLEAALVALNDEDEVSVFSKLRSLKEERLATTGFGRSAIDKSPHHVVIICPPLATNRAQISEFLNQISDAHISVLWVATERGLLPGECTTVITLDSANGGSIQSGRIDTEFVPDSLEVKTEGTIGRRLAALRDTSAAATSRAIPDSVALLDLPKYHDDSVAKVLTRWASAREGLHFPIGVGLEGEFSLSIVGDGPHGLVAGMTGAGKSELLQTMIASLALSYSPDFVNFVLIDYKGGSAFRGCNDLPHTVGFVTDLDEGLAERAIISLNAELRKREHQITSEGGAKDIIEFRRLYPESTMPSILIVIDEFAFLVKEIPVFVDRLVDIAQRGRSLGVHLILATQRPSGVISSQIQANTNLRIALRVASNSDSSDVIDSPIASTIVPAQRGRAFIKTGPKRPVEIQVAYAGRMVATASNDEGRAMTFNLSKMDLAAFSDPENEDASLPSDLDHAIGMCREAFAESGRPSPSSPWLEPLPQSINLDELRMIADPKDFPIGLVDLPDSQSRSLFTYDPRRDQSVALIGGPRSGKTNVMCLFACSLATVPAERGAWMYGIDFGHGGLSEVSHLPNWGGTGTASSLESVARVIEILDGLSAERQGMDVDHKKSVRPVVTFIDNWSAVVSALQKVEFLPYLERLYRLIADGRGISMFFVISAEREGVLSSTIASAIDTTLAFRLTNSGDLGTRHREYGARLLSLPSGRAIDNQGHDVQFAFPIPASPHAIARDTGALAVPGSLPIVRLLPESFPLHGLSQATSRANVPIGIDENWRPANLDLITNPYFLITGNPRTGKSTALATLVNALRQANDFESSFMIANRRSPLSAQRGWSALATGTDEVQALLPTIKNALLQNSNVLLVADDADDWADISNSLNVQLDSILKLGLDHQLTFLCSVSIIRAQRTFGSWLGTLKTQQSGLLLGGSQENSDIFQIRLPRPLNANEPPGRGFLVSPHGNIKIQVACN